MKPQKVIAFRDEDSGIMKSCCCCLDIRTGTLVLGVFHMLVHIAGLAILTQMLLHPEIYRDVYYDGYTAPRTADTSLGLLITSCSFIITVMLIYGTITRKPSYLLPFFCLQVFDFVVNMLGAVGVFYVPEFRDMIRNNVNNQRLMNNKQDDEMETKNLLLMAVTVSVFVLTIKAYLIAVVWSCYKKLVHDIQQQIVAAISQELNQDDTDCENAMLLPPYEEAVKETPTESPPPYTSSN